MKYIGYVLLLASLLCWGAGYASAASYLKESQSRPLLGTIVRMDVCYVDGRQDTVRGAVDRAWKRLEEINVRMNKFSPNSDVSLINKSQGHPIAVHEDVYRLIEISRKYSITTNGVFDVTVAPLVDLWRVAAKEGRYPAREEILDARAHVGSDKFDLLPDGKLILRDSAARMDLNGNAQGFAADEVAAILKEAELQNFLVDTGGEVYAAGVNCEGRSWRLGVKDPESRDALVDELEISDAAVSTSGDYERFYEIKGQKWSHIINPITGYPQSGVASATVIAPRSVEADILSTALCILGPAEGIKLIESLGTGYDALVIFRRDEGKYEWYSTSGYEDRRVEKSR